MKEDTVPRKFLTESQLLEGDKCPTVEEKLI